MQIEDFKRWQWALLGLAAGLIFAYAWQDHDVTGDKTYEMAEIKQNMFERDTLSKSRESGQAILQNVRVEPAVLDYQDIPKQIVTGKRLRFNPKDKKEYLIPFYYYAAVPYEPHLNPPGANLAKNATVMDYLAAAQKANPLLRYRFAWELENNWFFLIWAIGGMVVIGGIWPTVLNVLMGAGLGRPPKTAEEKENEAYLSRFGKSKKSRPVLAAKGPTEEEMQKLDDMNAAMEGQLAAAGVFATASAPAASDGTDKVEVASKIVPLQEAAADEKTMVAQTDHPEESEEQRRQRFAGGDFYPVSRGPKKS